MPQRNPFGLDITKSIRPLLMPFPPTRASVYYIRCMTDTDWQAYLLRMEEHKQFICAWQPADPDPRAVRCVQSRHRTLAHLRACQETWLEACIGFDQNPNPALKLLQPWRLFEQKSYTLVAWEEHFATYLADRERWKELLNLADRQKMGKIIGIQHSIESLTVRLVTHEHHHLFTPR